MLQFYLIQFENGRFVSWDDIDFFRNSNPEKQKAHIYFTSSHSQVARRLKSLTQEYVEAGINPPIMNIVNRTRTEIPRNSLFENHEKQ